MSIKKEDVLKTKRQEIRVDISIDDLLDLAEKKIDKAIECNIGVIDKSDIIVTFSDLDGLCSDDLDCLADRYRSDGWNVLIDLNECDLKIF